MTALFSFCQSENETPIHLFHGCIKTNLLWYWYKLKKSLKTKIDLPVNTPQSAIFGFLNYENNSDINNHLILIFKYYLFNSRDQKKLSLEVLKKKIVKIYNIEKQICLNNFKKTRKFRKKWEIIGHLLQSSIKTLKSENILSKCNEGGGIGGGVCLCIPGVCIVCLHMYLYIFKYICSETILAIFDTVIH